MQISKREVLQRRIEVLEVSRSRADSKYAQMIQRVQAELEQLPELPSLAPANDATGAPTFTRAAVELPSPSAPPDAPSLEDAPELARYVPTPEILALTGSAEVLQALGSLASPREEHELLSAWAVAENRAALTAVAVHVGGSLAERAARSLKRLGPVEQLETA